MEKFDVFTVRFLDVYGENIEWFVEVWRICVKKNEQN